MNTESDQITVITAEIIKAESKQKFVSFFFDNAVEEYNYEYRQLPKLYRDYKNNRI